MSSQNTIYRYANDPEYRKRQLAKIKQLHDLYKQYPVYVELTKVRNQLCNYRGSVAHHKKKMNLFKVRIERGIRKKEELEMEWGKIRGGLKRQAKANKIDLYELLEYGKKELARNAQAN